MATARDLQAQLAQARSPEEYVDMLQHGVTHFPRTALFWRLYAEHERSLSGPAAGLAVLEGGGSSALPWCRCDPELWRVACELRRDCGRREDELGPESKALGRAFALGGCHLEVALGLPHRHVHLGLGLHLRHARRAHHLVDDLL